MGSRPAGDVPIPQPAKRAAALFGAALAVLISCNACLALGFGLFGSQGNSIATGALLFVLPLLLFLSSFRASVRIQLPDAIFAGFVVTAMLSLFVNSKHGSRDGPLFALLGCAVGVCDFGRWRKLLRRLTLPRHSLGTGIQRLSPELPV
jgi:hypothetical protein